MRCQDVLPAVGPKPTRTRPLARRMWADVSELDDTLLGSVYVASTLLGAYPNEPSTAIRSVTHTPSRPPKTTVVFCLAVSLSPATTTSLNSSSSDVGKYTPTNGVNSAFPCAVSRDGVTASMTSDAPIC